VLNLHLKKDVLKGYYIPIENSNNLNKGILKTDSITWNNIPKKKVTFDLYANSNKVLYNDSNKTHITINNNSHSNDQFF